MNFMLQKLNGGTHGEMGLLQTSKGGQRQGLITTCREERGEVEVEEEEEEVNAVLCSSE